jgi:G3E family GTPase
MRSFMSRGWKFEPERKFDAARLDALFARWTKDDRIVRAKGIFHIGRAWRLANLVNGRMELHPIAFRRDNRVEVIALAASNLDWVEIEAELRAALTPPNVLLK